MAKLPQILFVTGKGGVGKTTVSSLLGMASAARGLKTAIVEVNGCQSVCTLFDNQQASYQPIQIQPNLHLLSITPEESMREFGLQQLKFKKIYKIVFENKYVKPLMRFAPGLQEASQLGKIYYMAEEENWDLIIVDAPATGHGLSLLESAKTMAELTKFGPMYNNSIKIEQIISDPARCNILLVGLAEELPVLESIELWQKFTAMRKAQTTVFIMNKWLQIPGNPDIWQRNKHKISDALNEITEITDLYVAKTLAQQKYKSKLANKVPLPIIEIGPLQHSL